MSAWIVDRAHIDVLVQALCEGEHVTDRHPDDVGRVLWQENLTSVAYRYPGDTGNGDRPGPMSFRDEHVATYTYRRPANKPSPAGVQKAVHCYDYQSCEHPGYEASEAKRWMDTLLVSLNRAIGKDAWDRRGEDLPWGFTEADVHGVVA